MECKMGILDPLYNMTLTCTVHVYFNHTAFKHTAQEVNWCLKEPQVGKLGPTGNMLPQDKFYVNR